MFKITYENMILFHDYDPMWVKTGKRGVVKFRAAGR
jgi:hypothetical protein